MDLLLFVIFSFCLLLLVEWDQKRIKKKVSHWVLIIFYFFMPIVLFYILKLYNVAWIIIPLLLVFYILGNYMFKMGIFGKRDKQSNTKIMKDVMIFMIIPIILICIIPYFITSKMKPKASTEYSSIPIKVSLNQSFDSKDFPYVKFKMLKIDKENNRCLLENETEKDGDYTNPQWYEKNKAVFPSVYGSEGVILKEITDNEVYVTIQWGSTE